MGPRRAHIRWRPAIKMAAAGMISRASRLRFSLAAAPDCKLFLRMLSFKSGPKSSKHEKDDPGFFASTINTFITKLMVEFNLILVEVFKLCQKERNESETLNLPEVLSYYSTEKTFLIILVQQIQYLLAVDMDVVHKSHSNVMQN